VQKQPRTAESPLQPAQRSALEEYGTDMTVRARRGGYESMVGREEELRRTIRVLAQRKSNCPILVGPPGTGKTSLVQGLAQRIAGGEVPPALQSKTVIELDLTALTAGASLVGQFEERLKRVLDEIAAQPGKYLVFVDEIHRLVSAGSHSAQQDLGANLIKRPLTDGELQLIGATTEKEYREIEKDAALARRFQRVAVRPLNALETVEVLRRIAPSEEKHHGVRVSPAALEAAARYAERHMRERFLPSSAVDLLANACSEAALSGAKAVTPAHVAAAVSEATGVPVGDVTGDERAKLEGLGERLRARVIGQDRAVELVANAMRRKRAGFAPGRPASFLLCGSTGTGKTHLARALAEALFGSPDAMVRLDMSEYGDKASVARLTGAAPGYVGYEEGGQLTEAVRRKPNSVVLLDEIEKAHPDALTPLLQVLDAGRLTDSQGREADFKNAVVICTSNLAARSIAERFQAGDEPDEGEVKSLLVEQYGMRPEFANRFGAIVPFRPLGSDQVRQIARLMVAESASVLRERGAELVVSEEAVAWLAAQGYDPDNGARPLRQSVERFLEDPLSELINSGEAGQGSRVEANVDPGFSSDRLAIRVATLGNPGEADDESLRDRAEEDDLLDEPLDY
jgi:ATP-dependent Clp protease ATP-binding subunit ClpC